MAEGQFAYVLRRLLDDTKIFSRRQWAEVLGVSQAAISQWVNEQTIPEPKHLRMVLDTLRVHDQTPGDILAEFDAIAMQPPAKISKIGSHFGGMPLSEYILQPLFLGFLREYSTLSPKLKEEALRRFAEICRELREENKPPSRVM